MSDTEIHMQGHRCVKCGENRVIQEGLMCHHCEDSMCAQCGGENEQQGRDRDLCVKCAKLEEAILKHAWKLFSVVKQISFDLEETNARFLVNTIESEAKL